MARKSLILKVAFFIIISGALLFLTSVSFAQQEDALQYTIDVSSDDTIPTPKIFRPSIDLSGRGSHREITWPQTVADIETIGAWQKDIGFSALFRLQYSLWEITQQSKDKELEGKLLAHYESIIKNISDSGGTVILNIFGTPPGLGRVLDKKSPPRDLKAFKEIVKRTIRDLSCTKRYNIWYEVWNAPDMEDFFLGRKQEYFNLYRAVAEAVKELEEETKIHIPIGGPSTSWWFQNLEGNTIITPERSLVYELIKFCYSYRLPLNFISWHGFSTSSSAENEITPYKKAAVKLIRDWLTYLHFDRDTPLVISEWNFDRNTNVLPERSTQSHIAASYIPSRIRAMYDAGIDYQLYYCLEDFQNNSDGVVRNMGIFGINQENPEQQGIPKASYNVFRMLAGLGKDFYPKKINDEFVDLIATRSADSLILLVYNYIDPEIVTNFLSRTISGLSSGERKTVLGLIQTKKLDKALGGQLATLRTTKKVGSLLKKARQLEDKAKKYKETSRTLTLELKNLNGAYLYERYSVDASCSSNCAFIPSEKKEVNATQEYKEQLIVPPYSVQLVVLTPDAKGQK